MSDEVRVTSDECERAPAGNAAKMREALESIIENLAIHIKCGRFVAPGDHVSFPIAEAQAYIDTARAALSAPGRNCDKYRTAEAAKDAWENQSGARDYDTFAWWCFATEEDMK